MTINTQKLRAFRQSLKRCVSNTGHGHVYMRPDGFLAKCGGPGICTECAKDLALLMAHDGYEPPTTDDLIDTIDAQAAEITRLKAAQVWQPIETAPKDRRILLMRDGNRICIGRYCPDRGALNVLPEYWTDEGYGVTWARNHPPTHWMPLPDAPVALQGDQQ